MKSLFANPSLVSQSWYAAARSRDLRRGTIRTYPLLNRRICLYRDHAGLAHALDAACPHLGADLGQGRVVGDQVECAFHRWRIRPDGRSVSAPDRCVRAYPIVERWGFIWLFNGPTPLFPLPEIDATGRWCFAISSRTLRCHPHLVVGNGLDARHFETLHGMQLTAPARLEIEKPYRVTGIIEGHPKSAWLRALTGSSMRASFTTVGGNLAILTVDQPRVQVLFAARPDQQMSRTQVIAFLPRDLDGPRALMLLAVLLRNDRRVLEGLDFAPRFTNDDAGLAAMAEAVNACGAW